MLDVTMFDGGPKLYLATSALALAVLGCCRKYLGNDSHPPLPPGPNPLPILGNVLSLDTRIWLSFTSWKSTYGDIIHVRLFNKDVVVVNSEEVAKDLFDGNSSIYSDRPHSSVYAPFGTDFNIAFLPYGDMWRLHRRIFHQAFRPVAVPAYHAVQLRCAHKMLSRLLQDPANYKSHLQMFSASVVLSLVYDYEPKAADDEFVHIMEKFAGLLVDCLTPLNTTVMEAFPFLLQIPTWFPGSIYKRASVNILKAGYDVKEIPFKYTKEKMATGQAGPCLVVDSLSRMNGFEDDAITDAVKASASVAYTAGSETTSATLLVFLLAMVLNPDVQAKVQAEIDRVIGNDRLPEFDDRAAMPYLEAVMRESLRWNTVAPLGLPHATTTSHIYKGYYIPKGATVFANAWAMTNNEEKYPNPQEFKPERFLQEDGSLSNDRMPLAFGWGRRICVGQHVADASLWIAMASFLAAFSVHNAIDTHGKEIPIVPKFTTGLVVQPEKFPCRIVPRFSTKMLSRMTGLESSTS